MTNNQSDGRWAAVGKIAALLGIIVAGITIYQYFFPRQEAITAEGRQSSIILEPATENAIEGFSSFTASHLQSLLSPITEKGKGVDDLKKELGDLTKDIQLVSESFGFPSIYPPTVIDIKLRNSGYRQAENVSIELGTAGKYLLAGQKEASAFSQTIPIGELKPGSDLRVLVWPSKSGLTYGSKHLVTYSNGSTEVTFPSGTFGSLDDPPVWPGRIMIGLGLVLAGVIIGSLFTRATTRGVISTPKSIEEADVRPDGDEKTGD